MGNEKKEQICREKQIQNREEEKENRSMNKKQKNLKSAAVCVLLLLQVTVIFIAGEEGKKR